MKVRFRDSRTSKTEVLTDTFNYVNVSVHNAGKKDAHFVIDFVLNNFSPSPKLFETIRQRWEATPNPARSRKPDWCPSSFLFFDVPCEKSTEMVEFLRELLARDDFYAPVTDSFVLSSVTEEENHET